MPAVKISNPRDLVVQLLGELLFVERRLADQVLDDVRRSVRDGELQALLERHREQTRTHAERLETAFQRLGVAPTSNLSRPFESAVAQHDDLAPSILDPRLADLFHAHAALHTEHWEMAAYRMLLPLLPDEVAQLLRPSFDEEGEAAKQLVRAIDRLAAEPADAR
jgi:ferritin-like metal-binding protein YciE